MKLRVEAQGGLSSPLPCTAKAASPARRQGTLCSVYDPVLPQEPEPGFRDMQAGAGVCPASPGVVPQAHGPGRSL